MVNKGFIVPDKDRIIKKMALKFIGINLIDNSFSVSLDDEAKENIVEILKKSENVGDFLVLLFDYIGR